MRPCQNPNAEEPPRRALEERDRPAGPGQWIAEAARAARSPASFDASRPSAPAAPVACGKGAKFLC
jgi:hypothetical protein